MSILNQIKFNLSNLSKAESRIAVIVLENAELIINITTAELARMANVSDPMISRFCKSFGIQSFPEFKVKLAQDLANAPSFISEAVSPGDTTATYIEKRVNANQAALEYIRKELSPTGVEEAVQTLANAKRIEIFGMGGSASIAQDAHHKLFRLGIPVTAHIDLLMQRMVAAGSNSDTVILVFSFTGRTVATADIAKIAKNNGAQVIAITHPESPLSQIADISIPSGDELEDTTIYVPMTTRIVILTIIDILVTGIALELGPELEQQLQKIKHSLDETKTPTS